MKITWDNPEQLSRYIATLRGAAEKLKTENLKLRRHHSTIQQIVCSLMNTDLLRDPQKWKEQIQDITKIMDSLITEGYSPDNMKSWRAFWDRQLYKALDLQYSIGLRALNENLPDIKIDLIFGYLNLFKFFFYFSLFIVVIILFNINYQVHQTHKQI